MINEALHVFQDEKFAIFEIYLNANDKIYIGEKLDTQDPYGFCMVIDKEDWPDIKRFIDRQFKSIS